jgi:hypothetical protein
VDIYGEGGGIVLCCLKAQGIYPRTEKIGFIIGPCPAFLVLTSRGKYAGLIYANTASVYQRHRRESELLWLFNTVKSDTRTVSRSILVLAWQRRQHR